MLEHIFEQHKSNIINLKESDNKELVINKDGYYKIDNFNNDFKLIIKKGIQVIIEENITSNQEISIEVEEDATVEYYLYMHGKVNVTNFTNIKGHLTLFYIDISETSKVTNTSDLNMYGAKLNVYSLIYGNQTNHKEYDLNVIHNYKNTFSDFNNYGVIDDEAYLKIDGISKVKKGMSKSNTHQSNKITSLSKTATSDLKPILYIDEFDIIGGHGASFGVVNEKDLYYMMSRGIELKEAKKIITLGNLVSKVPAYRLEYITEIIEKRMQNEQI